MQEKYREEEPAGNACLQGQAREKSQVQNRQDIWEAPWAGAGTEDAPYQIRTGEDLRNLYKYVKQKDFQGEFFRQEADIDLSANLSGKKGKGQALAEEAGSTWNPIGDMDHRFNGTYSGRGSDGILHKITGLPIRLQVGSTQYCGLFGCLGEQAAVRELGVEEAELDICVAEARVGVIAGMSYGTISDCYVSVKKAAAKDASGIGGIAGLQEKGGIKGCFVFGNLCAKGSTGAVGGIAGQNGARIESCYYSGTLTGEQGTDIGGITGNFGEMGKKNLDSGISRCYSLARIQGEEGHAGGISGEEPPAWLTVGNCYYLKGYVENGNAVGTGRALCEMLEDGFLDQLNCGGENTFYRPESQYEEASGKSCEFTPALCVFGEDPGQKDMLRLIRESASAVDLESMEITMTEESEEQAEFSWKTRNASACILRLEGQEERELPTEIKERCLEVGAEDDIKGELVIKNPYMKFDVIQEFSRRKPVFIRSFTVSRRSSKPQRLTGNIGDGFLSLSELADTDRAEDYQVSNKTPPPVYRDLYTCRWEVKRAKSNGITITSGDRTYSDIDPERRTYDYESTSSSATLTAFGEDGEKTEKTAGA